LGGLGGGGLRFQARLASANSLQDLTCIITRAKWLEGVAKAVECLLFEHEVLNSNPSPTKKEKQFTSINGSKRYNAIISIEGQKTFDNIWHPFNQKWWWWGGGFPYLIKVCLYIKIKNIHPKNQMGEMISYML
jgi:hypothetical protein